MAAGASAAVAEELKLEKDAFRGLLRHALKTSGKSGAQVADDTGGVIKRSTAYNYASPTYTGFPDSAERVEAYLKACGYEHVPFAVQTWKDIKRKESAPPAAFTDPAGLAHALIPPTTTSNAPSELPDSLVPGSDLPFLQLPRPVTGICTDADCLLAHASRDELALAKTVLLPRFSSPQRVTETRMDPAPASAHGGGKWLSSLFTVMASALVVALMVDLLAVPVHAVSAAARLPWVLLTAGVVMTTTVGALVLRVGSRPGTGDTWSKPWTTRGVIAVSVTVPIAVFVVGLLGEPPAAAGPAIGLAMLLLAAQWYATVDFSRLCHVGDRYRRLCGLAECAVIGALFGLAVTLIQLGEGLPVAGVVCIGLTVVVVLLHLLGTTIESLSDPAARPARRLAEVRREVRRATKPTRHRLPRHQRRSRRIRAIWGSISAVVILHQNWKFQPRAKVTHPQPHVSTRSHASTETGYADLYFDVLGTRFPTARANTIQGLAHSADRFDLTEVMLITPLKPAPKKTASRLALAAALTMTGRSFGSEFSWLHLARWAYCQAGVLIPSDADDLSFAGEPIGPEDIEPGDIIIPPCGVAGLYAGDGLMLTVLGQVRLVPLETEVKYAALRFFLPDHRPAPNFFPDHWLHPLARPGVAWQPPTGTSRLPRGSRPASRPGPKTTPRLTGPETKEQYPVAAPSTTKPRRLWRNRTRRRDRSAEGKQVSVHELLTRSMRQQQPVIPTAPPTVAMQPAASWSSQHDVETAPIPKSSLLQPTTLASKTVLPAWSVRRWRRRD